MHESEKWKWSRWVVSDSSRPHGRQPTRLLHPWDYMHHKQVAQWQRILLPMQETQFRSLGREDPLEEEVAAHSSILAWRIPWTEEPGGLHTQQGSVQAKEWWVKQSRTPYNPEVCRARWSFNSNTTYACSDRQLSQSRNCKRWQEKYTEMRFLKPKTI